MESKISKYLYLFVFSDLRKTKKSGRDKNTSRGYYLKRRASKQNNMAFVPLNFAVVSRSFLTYNNKKKKKNPD